MFIALVPGLARAETAWSVGAGFRYVYRISNDGLSSRDANGQDQSKLSQRRFEHRAMVGVAGKGENVDWGIDLRTAGGVTSEWLAFQQDQDIGIGVGQAYGRWHSKILDTDYAVTVGRAKTILLYENVGQNFADNTVRWDGFAWSFKHGMFGLNAVQYVIGAVSQGTAGASTYTRTDSSVSNANTPSHFSMLYAFQPYVDFKFSEDIKEKLVVGFFNWSGTGASSTAGTFANNVHGGTPNSTAGVAVGNVDPVIMDNAQQWQVYSDTSLPYDLRFQAEIIRNKTTLYGTRAAPANPAVEADRTAWALSLSWGNPKKAGDWFASYAYTNKGIASVISSFTNGDAAADNKSHWLYARYYYADNVFVDAKVEFHTEKAMLDGTGQPLAAPNNTRRQTQQRYQLVTNIQI